MGRLLQWLIFGHVHQWISQLDKALSGMGRTQRCLMDFIVNVAAKCGAEEVQHMTDDLKAPETDDIKLRLRGRAAHLSQIAVNKITLHHDRSRRPHRHP